MEKVLKIFKALSDETRIKIISLISEKGMCAKGIAKHLNITEAAVSQHIKILKEANLILGYKIGYHIVYDLNEESLKTSIKFIDSIIDNDNTNKYVSLNCSSHCKHMKCISNNEFREEESIMKVCFPVKSNEGMASVPYGHFGSAPEFLIFNLENNELKTIGNGDLDHEHGKCQPIKALSGEIVDAVVVGGIGAGAINKLNSMGIKVYKAIEGNIQTNVEALKESKLKEFSVNNACVHHNCKH